MHGEDGEVSVEDLHWVVEDLALDCLSLFIFGEVFSVYFCLSLSEEVGVVFLYEVVLIVLHILLMTVSYTHLTLPTIYSV